MDSLAVAFLFLMRVGGVVVALGMTFYEKIMPLVEGLAYAAVATGVAVVAVRYLKHRRDKMRRERQKPIEFDLLSRKKD